MQIIQITLGLKRTIRHKEYCISTPEVSLVADISEDEDQVQAVDDLHDDLLFIIEKLVRKEKEEHDKGNL